MKITVCEKVVVVLTALLCGYHVTSGCDVDLLLNCTKEYDKYNSDTVRDEASVRAQCDLLPDMDRCIRRGMDDCDPNEQRIHTGRLNGHHYICDHLNVYITHQECFVSDELKAQIHDCTHTVEKYEAASDETFCSHVIDNFECVRTRTLHTCGSEEAANFMSNAERKILLPLLQKRNCVSSGLSTVVIIGISVGSAVLFAVLTATIVFIIYKRYARRKEDQQLL